MSFILDRMFHILLANLIQFLTLKFFYLAVNRRGRRLEYELT